MIAQAESKNRLGDPETAERLLAQAAELAQRLADPALLTRAVLALPSRHWPAPGECNPRALLLAQRALAFDGADACGRAMLAARIAAELCYFPDTKGCARELSSRAMGAVAGAAPHSELCVRLYRDPVLRGPEILAQRLSNAEEIVRLAAEVGDYDAYFSGAVAKAAALSLLGEMAHAYNAMSLAAGSVAITGSLLHRGIALAFDASRAVTDGRFSDARHSFNQCLDLAGAGPLSHLVDVCWPTMLMPLGEEGRLAEIERLAEDTVRRRPGAPVFCALLAWLKIGLEKREDAQFLLDRLAADDFLHLSGNDDRIAAVAALAEVCTALNRTDCAALLYDRLAPYAELNAALSAAAVFGSVDRYLGKFALLLGRLDEALVHFERSLAYNRRIGARPWAAYSRWGLAAALLRRGAGSDRARATELLAQAESEAERLKMGALLTSIRNSREPRRLGDGRAAANKGAIDHLPPLNPARGSRNCETISQAPAPGNRVALFRRTGDIWELGLQPRTFSLKHRLGLELICRLIHHRGHGVSVLELAPAPAQCRGSSSIDGSAVFVELADPILDEEAKRSYRARLGELAADLEEARKANDFGRAAKLRQEQDFVTHELARSLGLFGRSRKFRSESERARKRVKMAIERALRLIARNDPSFGRLLERSISTGTLCSFSPDPENPVEWRL